MKYLVRVLAIAFTLALVLPSFAFGDEEAYYFDKVYNAGLDTGYSETNLIEEGDPHFGWKIGTFKVSGFTQVADSSDGSKVFLKTVGDTVVLSFTLSENIDALNGNGQLSVNSDSGGFDQLMGISKTELGRGALFVRYTDYQNATHAPEVYVDYFEGIEVGATTEVQLCEEGDYEVVLDYELCNDVRKVGPISIFPEYCDYSIRFNFSVRNGNCMIFPLDAQTGSELTNESYAPNGFKLDLANSRFLDINVKRDVVADGSGRLVEDTRFNGPACDGDVYSDEGIYTLTAMNKDTGQSTVKVIYVGDNPTLKTYAEEGKSVEEMNALIDSDELCSDEATPVEEGGSVHEAGSGKDLDTLGREGAIVVVAVIAASAVALFVVFAIRRKKKLAFKRAELLSVDVYDVDPHKGDDRGGSDA